MKVLDVREIGQVSGGFSLVELMGYSQVSGNYIGIPPGEEPRDLNPHPNPFVSLQAPFVAGPVR